MLETEKDNKKVTVLGKTFNSDEERRAYFREELRKHLPELKKMEGFPIGEDEDILNLSDPPYYTACPNPWLNDFVAEWEVEKNAIKNREPGFKVNQPFAADVSVGKTHAVYRGHAYHTKVPHIAIMKYLNHYTQPGDTVLDSFAGTGMTGVAAYNCGNISEQLQIGIHNQSIIGARRAICGDLSPIASFIASNFNKNHNLYEERELFKKILNDLDGNFNWMFKTKHSESESGQINYTVWSEWFNCNSCGLEFPFWGNGYLYKPNEFLSEFECPGCKSLVDKRKLGKVFETKFDTLLGEVVKQIKVTPALINYSFNGKRYHKIPDQKDLDLIQEIEGLETRNIKPYIIPIGDKTGEPRRMGLTNVHHLFTKRMLVFLDALLGKCDEYSSPSALFLLTGIMQRASKLHKFKKGQTTGITNGTLYIPSLFYEYSGLKMFSERPRYALNAFKFVGKGNLTYTGSATKLNLNDDSIDYIFVDPPFGANLMYSELNFMWESWLKVITNVKNEAIENKSQSKSLFNYQELMLKSFSEYYRVLKKGKWMTVEFSNTSAAVWNSIQTVLQNSGFVIANVAGLDKKQGSFNAMTNATSVKQDLVISCYKPSSKFDEKFRQHQNTDVAVWDFVEEHLNHLPVHLVKENATTAIIERSPKILFDRLIAFYVQKGLPVPIDAGAFQKGLRERFIERDGMFFTNEQVQEYDKKKRENPEFIQLSILVSSEQDGVLWLKNVLTEKPLTYQDIQPLWMQALAGVRKGDVIPELADILEENFLKDNGGKWYTPDPENEADLEKLRTKRLLKQFDTYKTEAAKPKAKNIKEVRVEALRVGFKQCYQDKDFQSIVAVGDKIPNNLLMEDEVLLQFYDIASTRV